MIQPTQPGAPKIIKPDQAETKHFLADFDGTIANTLEKIQNGVSVEEAYAMAMENIFGAVGKKAFEDAGGLQNRAPMELMHAITEGKDVGQFVNFGTDFLTKNIGTLQGFVPSGLGASLDFSDPKLSLSELLVREKLRILSEQIGRKLANGNAWPNACQGFVEFYQKLAQTEVCFGVISSGHHKFINQCFQMWNLMPPTLIISDDTMRSTLAAHLESAQKSKPESGPGIMAKLADPSIDFETTPYAGDAPKADGEFAKNTGMPFILFKSNHNVVVGNSNPVLEVDDWKQVAELINDQGKLILPIK